MTPNGGVSVGKNLDVAGVKDRWDLSAGPNGISTADRIGPDAANVFVDAAAPLDGTAPHLGVTLPGLGDLTGGGTGSGGLDGVPVLGGVLGDLAGGTLPGGSTPGGSNSGGTTTSGPGGHPGTDETVTPGGLNGTPSGVTVPVPVVGTVRAGTTPNGGVSVGKNLNVAGVKDLWDLTAGPRGISTADRIGPDAAPVFVDGAVPFDGGNPHLDLALPGLGDVTGAVPGGSLPGGSDPGGSVPGGPIPGGLSGLPVVGGILGGLPSAGSIPGGSDSGVVPGGLNGTPSGVTVPVPGVGSVRAGTTPNGGVSVGKNLNVAGVKDLWDLTTGPKGVSTADRIGPDAVNVFVDGAVPFDGTAPHLGVTLPAVGDLTRGNPGQAYPGGNPGGTIPGAGGLLGGILGGLPGVSLPGGSTPGGSGTGVIPGGLNGTPSGVTVPVPGVGSVRAGTTPNGGVSVGKNLNVAGVKDLWDLTAGPKGISTADRIGPDAANAFLDAAVPFNGDQPHVLVTLPAVGDLPGLLGGLPTGSLPGGQPGGSLPGGSDSGVIPGGLNGTPTGVTVPVPGLGTVRAGTTPNGGVSVGKNLNVAGVKDLWDLTAGPRGISTADRIGPDALPVFVDGAIPFDGTAPQLGVALPGLGDLTGAIPGGTIPGGKPGGSNPGGSVPGLGGLPVIGGLLGGLPTGGQPGGSTPGGSGSGVIPGGLNGTPSAVTVPVPGVGSVRAGTTPNGGVSVGKNLNVAGVKDLWDLTAGPRGISTADRIGPDAANAFLDAAVPFNGDQPHVLVTLPAVGDLPGLLGGLPTGSLPGGQPGGSVPGVGGLGSLPVVGGLLGGLPTGGLPIGGQPGGSNPGGSVPGLGGLPVIGGLLGGLPTGGQPGGSNPGGSVPGLGSLPVIGGLLGGQPGGSNPGGSVPGLGGLGSLPVVGGLLGGLPTGGLPTGGTPDGSNPGGSNPGGSGLAGIPVVGGPLAGVVDPMTKRAGNLARAVGGAPLANAVNRLTSAVGDAVNATMSPVAGVGSALPGGGSTGNGGTGSTGNGGTGSTGGSTSGGPGGSTPSGSGLAGVPVVGGALAGVVDPVTKAAGGIARSVGGAPLANAVNQVTSTVGNAVSAATGPVAGAGSALPGSGPTGNGGTGTTGSGGTGNTGGSTGGTGTGTGTGNGTGNGSGAGAGSGSNGQGGSAGHGTTASTGTAAGGTVQVTGTPAGVAITGPVVGPSVHTGGRLVGDDRAGRMLGFAGVSLLGLFLAAFGLRRRTVRTAEAVRR